MLKKASLKEALQKERLTNNQQSRWVVIEDKFNSRYLGKYETIMCLGNGYMGCRSALEEKYLGEKRNLFIAGTFNRLDAEGEVTELPNCADIFEIDMEINGERFSLELGEIQDYIRTLNLKDGELCRSFIWETQKTGRIRFEFKRFVSLKDLHIIGQQMTIAPLDKDLDISLESGINGQVTNSGVQHFSETSKRLFEGKYLQMVQTTLNSKIDIIINLVHNFFIDGGVYHPDSLIAMDRRKIFYRYGIKVPKASSLVMEKTACCHTSRDRELIGMEYSLEQFQNDTCKYLLEKSGKGYDFLMEESRREWDSKVWSVSDIEISGGTLMDQLALRFAQYHMIIMTPAHDNRMNIGAKGLTGEGYKGHTFWDTEIFILPYFIWTHPAIARSLLEYRYLSLPGAHKKANENGYKGAMFPWESAWLDDGETTPVWGAADIITGTPTKIWSGFIEQHITADIAYAILNYYSVSGDDDYMEQYGYEILIDTAVFWSSRLEWNSERNVYCINDVVGPDEYKEHVNNDAFTNYMALLNIRKAIHSVEFLKSNKPSKYSQLDEKFDLAARVSDWEEKIQKLYLPMPGEDGILPQDDQYLNKRNIDLTKYKNQEHVGEIFKDYNLDQVNNIQVSKQPDVILLMYLQKDLFTYDIKRKNWDYYEQRTLHDSSLSYSIHSLMANEMGLYDTAYRFFTKSCEIDLGPNMKSSDHGIHAASLGGIWQCAVNGFGGVSVSEGKLSINPKLPSTWKGMSFTINWHRDVLKVEIMGKKITITNITHVNSSIPVEVQGNIHELGSSLTVGLL